MNFMKNFQGLFTSDKRKNIRKHIPAVIAAVVAVIGVIGFWVYRIEVTSEHDRPERTVENSTEGTLYLSENMEGGFKIGEPALTVSTNMIELTSISEENAESVQCEELSDELKEDDVAQKAEAEKRFIELCDEYDSCVMQFNDRVEKYNNLIDGLSEFVLEGLPEKLSTIEDRRMDFDEYYRKGADSNSINGEIENIMSLTDEAESKYYELRTYIIEKTTKDYNDLVVIYNLAVHKTSVDFISDIPRQVMIKRCIEAEDGWTDEEIIRLAEENINDIQRLGAYCNVVLQITNPATDWVISQLIKVDSRSVRWPVAVTADNDPNGMLGKDGGYTGCVYFNVKAINLDSVKGVGIVGKGTDVGGAIEIYATVEDAKNRCEYLSQYDNTLLWSGSYAIVGTMVVRTSCYLSDSEQVALTDEIVRSFTKVG